VTHLGTGYQPGSRSPSPVSSRRRTTHHVAWPVRRHSTEQSPYAPASRRAALSIRAQRGRFQPTKTEARLTVRRRSF